MKKIIYILAVGLALSLFSCSKSWLDVEPTESIPSEKAFSTKATFEASVVGVYYSLQSKSGFGNYLIEASELRGEDMILKQRNNWGHFSDFYKYSYMPTSSTGNDIYLDMYEIIEGCNSILDVENAGRINLPEVVKNPLLAEVKTMRALSYFNLVRLFCQPYTKDNGASPGVPLKITSDVGIEKGRGTVKEVYDLILEDLKYGVDNLKVTKATDRIGLTYVQGLLARVYLALGDNENAVKYAELAIASAPALSSDMYTYGVSQKNNNSIIFSLQYTTDTYSGYLSYSSFHDYGWKDQGGYGSIGATEDFYKKYSDNDLRKSWFINRWVYENKLPYGSIPTWTDMEEKLKNKAFYQKYAGNLFPVGLWDDTLNGISKENINRLRVQMFDASFFKPISMYGKFPRLDAERAKGTEPTNNSGTANLGNVPMMRTPELYLIVAEASALKGDYMKAKTYLENLQKVAKAEVFNGSNSDLLEAIRLERRKELIGEGFRIFDIIRQGKVINRTSYWGGSEGAIIDPTKAESKVYLPIPQKEIDANSKLKATDQNLAY